MSDTAARCDLDASSQSPRSVSRLRKSLAKIDRIAHRAVPVVASWWWPAIAIAVGAVPFAVSYATGLPGHQIVSALALSFMCLGFARVDRWLQGIVAIALVFASHSMIVIVLSRSDPARCAPLLPKAADYWDKQRHWIRTGEDIEYELNTWVPAHIYLAVGGSILSFTSLGVAVFHDGLIQVDMMNYYNARLGVESDSQLRAMTLGWHIWSLMRGVGFLFLCFETISLSLQVFSMRELSPWKVRQIRWALGIGFLLLDAAIKFFATESVRQQLENNLL